MPKVSDSQKVGDFGENHVRNVVETGWGCIFLPTANRDRYGIDGIITDVVNGKVQPLQFNVQIKAGRFKDRVGSNEFRVPIKKADMIFWRGLNVPVVLICVDINGSAKAYWQIIRPNTQLPLYMSRKKEFGLASRDAVVGAVRKAIPLKPGILPGKVLAAPLNIGARESAKSFYRDLKEVNCIHPTYGTINFTWKGWRHITRKRRSVRKIMQALILLPSVAQILNSPIHPVESRELKSIRRGNLIYSRTLLIFKPRIVLSHRADAHVRVVIERDTVFPADWATSAPIDPRRRQTCRFYSFSELRESPH